MKKFQIIFVTLVLVSAGCSASAPLTSTPITPIQNYKNTAYLINGNKITLINGTARIQPDANSASETIIQYFGNEAAGDFNNDGVKDIAFLLTSNSGGSGTFYYVAAALNAAGPAQGTNAILLGDRISPQTTEFTNGKIIVNYADRKPDEPMTASPSVGVSKYFRIQNGLLVEITKP